MSASRKKTILLSMPLIFLVATIISCLPACRDAVGGVLGLRLICFLIHYLTEAHGTSVIVILIIYLALLLGLFSSTILAARKTLLPFALLVLSDLVLSGIVCFVLRANGLPSQSGRFAAGSLLEVIFFAAIAVICLKNRPEGSSFLRWKKPQPGKVARVMLCSVLLLLFTAFLAWSMVVFRYETITYRYGDEFSEVYKGNTMIGEPAYWKVLSYNEKTARVYFVEEDGASGNILVFEKQGNDWTYYMWETTVWSRTGSASAFVWPYIR